MFTIIQPDTKIIQYNSILLLIKLWIEQLFPNAEVTVKSKIDRALLSQSLIYILISGCMGRRKVRRWETHA